MSLASRLAKGAGITFVGMAASKALSFLYRIAVGREMGPELYGFLTLGIASFMLAQNLANISVDEGIKRFVPEDYSQTSKYLFSALKVSLPFSIISSAVLFIFAGSFVDLLGFESQMTTVFRIMAIAVPFGVASSSLNSVFVAREKMRFVVYVNHVFQNSFKLASGVAALALGFGLAGVTWGFALSAVLSMFLSAYYVLKNFDISIPDSTNSSEILRYSWPLFLSGMIGFVLNWTDTFMIGALTQSATQVGVYNAAFPLAQTLTIFLSATSQIAFPIMSGLYANKKMNELSEFYRTNTRWVTMFTLPAFLLMVLFPSQVLSLTFGSEYLEASNALRILAGGFFVATLVGPSGQLLKSADRTKFVMYNNLGGAIANVLLNLFLIPVIGIAGAAYASIASNLIVNVSGALENYWKDGVHGFHRDLLPLFASAGVALALTYSGIKYFQPVTPLRTLIPGVIVFGGLYGLGLIVFGALNPEDRDIIVGAGRKIGYEEEAGKLADLVIRD
jgi:O-antigen/teichoic acid export membrane protein